MHKITYPGGITCETVFDTRRVKDEILYPVKYRVTFLRKQVYYNSGVAVTKEEWEEITTSRKPSMIEKRGYIQGEYAKLCHHIKSLIGPDGDGFTFTALNNRLKGALTNSVIPSMLERSERYRKEGRLGTADWYKYASVSIQKFTGGELRFSDISQDWFKRYETYLLTDGKSLTTISMHMRALQGILNDALSQGIITRAQYPIGKGKYKIRQGSGRKKALTRDQVKTIKEYSNLSMIAERCRDLWYFSYLCNGINMNDLCRLKYSNLVDVEIRFHRRKTINTTANVKEIVATLLPEMELIIKRWGNQDRTPTNYIFPFFYENMTPTDEQRVVKNVTRLINKKMKLIGEDLGYGSLSTYTARHSFATVLKRSGVNIAFISEGLGHTDLKTTETYLASFDKEERAKNAALLTD